MQQNNQERNASTFNTQPIMEVLPKSGLVYSEKSTLSEILSKPKILPLKSITLEKLEQMEKEAVQIFARPLTTAHGGLSNLQSSNTVQ